MDEFWKVIASLWVQKIDDQSLDDARSAGESLGETINSSKAYYSNADISLGMENIEGIYDDI